MAVNDIVMGAAGASGPATFIEDVFSTWLYTGNGSTQTITNGIDLSGKGGLVWAKERSATGTWHQLRDTNRGGNKEIYSNDTAAQGTSSGAYTFLSNGYTIGGNDDINLNTKTYASWTFREQPKFFDIVTYTGNGVARTIAHNLGSVPGCIIIKDLDYTDRWYVYHRSLGATKNLALNETSAQDTNADVWNNTEPTSSVFTLGDWGQVNRSGYNYVAYLFAHDAGGFGATGTDNVISCGSYVGNGGTQSITLGYEPQWLLIKKSNGIGNWFLMDNMRGLYAAAVSGAVLFPNNSNAENATYGDANVNSTGFTALGGVFNNTGDTYIYIAIRRPMKTPTTGTEVFAPITTSNDSTVSTTNFVTDSIFSFSRAGTAYNATWWDRLRGATIALQTSNTGAEASFGGTNQMFQSNTTFGPCTLYGSGTNVIQYAMRRAPGFFDVVCYTGNDTPRNINHNLTVAPELMIIKNRSSAINWQVSGSVLGSATDDYMILNLTNAKGSQPNIYATPTSTTFGIGTYNPGASGYNLNGANYVAYLFASIAGVSKVGSYTGNGSSQTINCGFTSGARFFLVKATSTTGSWWTYDSARGIVSSNDPALQLNSTAAEVTSADAVDADSSGIIVNQEATCSINASGVSYIFLSIA